MFFIYLNKAIKIVSSDIQNFTTWVQGIELNLHGFNTFPVDGTNLIWLHGKIQNFNTIHRPHFGSTAQGVWNGREVRSNGVGYDVGGDD